MSTFVRFGLRFAVAFVAVAALSPISNCGWVSTAHAEGVEKDLAAKLAPKFELIKKWAADKTIVDAVKGYNAAPSAEAKAMTQDKWKSAPVLDPFVRGLTKVPAAVFLKDESKKDDSVSEAFLSGADGCKVAFLSKTSNWCHKGKPKHDTPMTGKDWTSAVEVDESTGMQQVQIAVPVLDGGKSIGSLVVGFSVPKLKK